MPKMRVTNRDININEQGYLLHLEDWSEAYVKKIAKQDNIKLYNDHWEIIFGSIVRSSFYIFCWLVENLANQHNFCNFYA